MMNYIKPYVRCQVVKKSLVIGIIIELYMRSQGASQKQLVDALNMRPATVSEQTDILIELGYVTKHIDYMDKRISVVTLTDEGKRLGKTLLHTFNEFL